MALDVLQSKNAVEQVILLSYHSLPLVKVTYVYNDLLEFIEKVQLPCSSSTFPSTEWNVSEIIHFYQDKVNTKARECQSPQKVIKTVLPNLYS